MTPTARTMMLVGFALAALALFSSFRRRDVSGNLPHIRPAGPQNMRAIPESWDIVDEQADQSFPASDPPGNY